MLGPSDDLQLDDLIVAAIRRLMRAVDLHSRRLAEECGLTGPQLATLREVDRRRSVSASTLARSVHLSGATMTGILNRLEKRGLVARTRGEQDRRTILVSATDLGQAVLARAPSLLQDEFRERLERLEAWEQLMMLANLQRIASMMDAEALDAAPHLIVEPPDATNERLPSEPPVSPGDDAFRHN
ncbi:MAG: MarR family transcriptional regulator [Planctomycetes bacterium]|nr:MarR family transcriptional regulator [Planctomycetota bacterium]